MFNKIYQKTLFLLFTLFVCAPAFAAAPSISNFSNGSTISSKQVVKFSKNGNTVNGWWLRVGSSTSSTNNLYDSGSLSGSVTQHTISGLPSGKAAYITFYYRNSSGSWVSQKLTVNVGGTSTGSAAPFGYYPGTDHAFCPPLNTYKSSTYKSYGQWDNSVNYNHPTTTYKDRKHFGCRTQKASSSGSAPSISNLSNGATIARTQVVKFSKNGTVVNWWYVVAGSTKNSKNYYDSGNISGSSTQHTIKGLPSGKTIHITLLHYGAAKKWIRRHYTVNTTSGTTTTTLTKSGPITATKNGQVIQNKDINSTRHDKCAITVTNKTGVIIRNVNISHAGGGICVYNSPGTRIEKVRVISKISKKGPHCRDGVSFSACLKSRRTHAEPTPKEMYPPDSHHNIYIRKSKDVVIDTAHVEKGESGILVSSSDRTKINNLRCYDMRGPYFRGQCVQFVSSDHSRLTKFYAKQFEGRSSGNDNIAAYESDYVVVSNGLVDGNWSTHGVGVIADAGSDNMTVTDVDTIHMGPAGFNAWSSKLDRIPNNFTVRNGRVKDGHCKGSWKGDENTKIAGGGQTFSVQPGSKNGKFYNSRYWNHCRSGGPNIGAAVIKDVKKANFTLKKDPTSISFPWLK